MSSLYNMQKKITCSLSRQPLWLLSHRQTLEISRGNKVHYCCKTLPLENRAASISWAAGWWKWSKELWHPFAIKWAGRNNSLNSLTHSTSNNVLRLFMPQFKTSFCFATQAQNASTHGEVTENISEHQKCSYRQLLCFTHQHKTTDSKQQLLRWTSLQIVKEKAQWPVSYIHFSSWIWD